MDCHSLNDEQLSAYCRENGIYPHHVKEWKSDFLSENQAFDSTPGRNRKNSSKKTNACRKSSIVRIERSLKRLPYWSYQKSAKRSGEKGGRLISFPDRKQYCALIDEAVQNGARQQLACELVGIASRTYQRWNQGEELSEDQRIYNNAPAHNTLSEAVRQEILKVINLPEYSTLTPYQIVPTLLDLGQYIASESTFLSSHERA